MKDLQYMEGVGKGVFEIIKREKALDNRIEQYISSRQYRSDNMLLIRYSKRHKLYEPELNEEIIFIIEKLQAHLRKDYDVFTTLTEDEESIFIVAVRIPKAPTKEKKLK